MGFRGRKLNIGKTRRKKVAPAKVRVGTRESKGKTRECYYAKCLMSDLEVGPSQTLSEASKRRLLAELTRQCPCPARYHREE